MSEADKELPRLYLTRAELGQAFGVGVTRITRWTGEGMPVYDKGGSGRQSRYDLAAVIDWQVDRRVRQARESGSGAGGGGPVDLALERAKLTRAMTVRALLEVGLKRRELLPASEVRQVFGACVHAVRAGLLAMPQAIAEQCTVAAVDGPAAVEGIIKRQVYDVLRGLAQWPGTLLENPQRKSG